MVDASAMTVPRMRMGRRPMISAGDAQIRGPRARPRAGMATVQFACSRVAEYASWSSGKDGTVVVVM